MNKYQEAKNYIDNILKNPKWSRVDIEWQAIDELKELLDKETPIKPIDMNIKGSTGYLNGFCGNYDCNYILDYSVIKVYRYCPKCGQRIDWIEE